MANTHHLPVSLDLASATAKPVKQELSLSRKQILELPQAASPRGCGICDRCPAQGSLDLQCRLAVEKEVRSCFFSNAESPRRFMEVFTLIF